jgi:hydroxymethylpyrimidine pyrophosphatase-like HAD family hydrolase
MIAIDMDGTLLGPDGRVSDRNIAALKVAASAGIEIVVATGRRHCYAMRVLEAVGLPTSNILVSSNGTVTRTIGSSLIDRTLMPVETTLWLCEHLDEFRNAMVITYDLVQPDGDDLHGALVVQELEGLHASIGKWMEANAVYIERSAPLEEVVRRRAAVGEAPIQIMLCGAIERMRRAEARLLEHPAVYSAGVSAPQSRATAWVALNRTEYPDRDLSLVDILPAACSKGTALLRLAAARGIAGSEIMAIGDNWNDVSMLEVAGRPVLMENAPGDLKQFAAAKGWPIGGHHGRDGVADAIEHILPARYHRQITPFEEQGEQLHSGSLKA